MSNISTVTPTVAELLQMRIEKTPKPIYFGSATHGGLVEITQVATSTVSPYLGSLVVTPAGKSSLITAYWFSQMGYEFVLHAQGKGFSLINALSRQVIYVGEMHTDKFCYVPWSLVENLRPASVEEGYQALPTEAYRQVNCFYFVNQVCEELDEMEGESSHFIGQSNSTKTKDTHISSELIHMIHENHSRYGHQNPRQMAETLHRQARADFPTYTAAQILKVMNRWPCLFCKGAAMRRGTENIGSGIKLPPSEAGAVWSLDNKGKYTPAYHWGHTAIHLFECLATGKSFHRAYKAPNSAKELLESIQALCVFTKARGKIVKEIRTDAGPPEMSEAFRVGCARRQIEVSPAPPKAQHLNPVERLIETVDNKVDAIIASARQGSTLTDALWYSAFVIALRSSDTQIRPGYHQTKTPWEQMYGNVPNMQELFPYRLGQIVVTTELIAHPSKTDHHMAGVVCYTLHSENKHGTWCYCPHPNVNRAYLRSPKDIQAVEFKDIPNQHTLHFLPTRNGHPTYPAESVLRFIEEQIDLQTTPVVKEVKEQPIIFKNQADISPTIIPIPHTALAQQDDTPASDSEDDQQENHDAGTDPYIGKKIRKKFNDNKWYEGIVKFTWKDNKGVLRYRVEYEDGEKEDLTVFRVSKIIVPAVPAPTENSSIGIQSFFDITTEEDGELQDYYEPQCNSTDYPQLSEIEVTDEVGGTFSINSTISSTARPTEFPIHTALKKDRARWEPQLKKLMNEHINNLCSLKMVHKSSIPPGAVIIPGTMICKEDKVDTSVEGEHLMDGIRLIAQDTRSEHNAGLVYSSVASSKAIKLVIAIATWNWLIIGMLDIVKAFPSTPLPAELEGKIFLKLSKSIMDVMGYDYEEYAQMLTAVEGMKRSNKIYDTYLRKALEKEGFKFCPNDEQVISYKTDDGHFFLAAKVVDNIIYASTHQRLTDKFISAIEKANYRVKIEARDKFIGMQIEELGGQNGVLLHQERQILKIGTKYNIPLTAYKDTPLPGTFNLKNDLESKESPAIEKKLYQQAMGDLLYLNLTNCATPYASSALARKTEFCSERDMKAVMHVFEYLMSHRKEGIHFKRAPPDRRPRDVRHILRLPIQTLISYDGAHNQRTADSNPYDQVAHFSKLYAEYNGAIKVASQIQRIGLSSTEAEVAALVKALRCALDTYFILNHIGFSNISKIVASGDNISCKTLCTESSPTQKRSKHFNMNAAWVRQFSDDENEILQLVYTPTGQLTSNSLTKRVTAREQAWSTDDIRGANYHPTVMSTMEQEPIRASSHLALALACSTMFC